jgi:trk system potassium uptake protein TrkH
MKLRGPRLLALSFLALIIVGTIALLLPGMALEGENVSVIDALFTSTSAVCVTGLITINPPETFSGAGMTVILVLIQLGGLGIMTFSALFLTLLRRQFDLSSHRALSDAYSGGSASNLPLLLIGAVGICLASEAIGALLLYHTLPGEPGFERGFDAVFHSVSAFCNAGFSTYPDSLIRLGETPIALWIVMGLIVTGGLGFFVIIDLIERFVTRRRRRLRLQSRLVLGVSAGLTVLGALGIHLSEHDNVFADSSVGADILHSLFQSVTARTAGFNTIDLGEMRHFGLFIILLLMIVGGSPGSTAGGVKTTTLGIILATLWSHLRGRDDAEIFGRRIPKVVVQRAFIVVAFSLLIMGVTFVALRSLNAYDSAALGQKNVLVPVGFEIVSAFATVGLSAGVTPHLHDVGKLIIIALMFIGRLGPLTLAIALVTEQRPLRYRLPEENVMVG